METTTFKLPKSLPKDAKTQRRYYLVTEKKADPEAGRSERVADYIGVQAADCVRDYWLNIAQANEEMRRVGSRASAIVEITDDGRTLHIGMLERYPEGGKPVDHTKSTKHWSKLVPNEAYEGWNTW